MWWKTGAFPSSDREPITNPAVGPPKVGQVPLQQVEVPVDRVREPETLDLRSLAPTYGTGPLGDFVVDAGGGHYRLLVFDAGPVLVASGGSPLASVHLAMETGVHPKACWRRTVEG